MKISGNSNEFSDGNPRTMDDQKHRILPSQMLDYIPHHKLISPMGE